ncbi:MAG: FTR1 family protein [Clostridiales bacterium]|nr:FTR1 family protein [Clostridiales bacterium]
MGIFLPGTIMGFREGLEAFLVVSIMLRYISKTNNPVYKKYIYYGAAIGVVLSVIFGAILTMISNAIVGSGEVAKIWESIASIIALILITTFIVWMIKHGSRITQQIESQVDSNLSKWGIFSIATIMIAREGAEIAIFSFTGKYTILSIAIGVLVALIIAVLIYYSLIKVNLKTIFAITLGYLILQAGFLLGYGIHEGLSALKALGKIQENSLLLNKAFDLSGTVFYHKEGAIGVPLYVLFGWYSKPEWIQFISQYAYTLSIFLLWLKKSQNTIKEKM